MKYKGVIFDLDDTLYDYKSLNSAATAKLCAYGSELLGISYEDFSKAYQWGRDETKRILSGNPSARNRLLYMQHTLEYLCRLSFEHALLLEECYWGYILDHMQPFDGVLEILNWIHRQEVKVAICTDLTADIQFHKIRKLGIEEYIDVLVTSEETGREKPDPAMFCLCLQKLKLCPEETLMVGDRYVKDVQGALRVGMDAVLYGGDEADGTVIRIRNFKELEQFFGRITYD